MAGVLAAYQGAHSVDAETARGALALVAYSLQTWRAVIDEGATDPTTANALRLYDWLTDRSGWRAKVPAMLREAPACVRTRDKRDAALDMLIEHGLVEIVAGVALALEPQ